MAVAPQYWYRHDPSLEQPLEGEDELAQDLTRMMLRIAEKTYADSGHAIRSVHAKSHGLLKVALYVVPGLPLEYAQGIFAAPAIFDGIARFSTIPGDLLDDDVSTPRGIALKFLDVPGERLEGSEGASTQDFVMVNGPRFTARNGQALLRSLKLLVPTTDRAPRTKKVVSAAMRNLEKLIEAFGGESGAVKALGGQPPVHILGETYFTQLPIRFGDHVAKLQLAPVSPGLVALTGTAIDLKSSANALRDAVVRHFQGEGGEWDLRAQLCTNLDDMPIDDPRKVWDEATSPFVTVARLVARPQQAWSEARSRAVDDGMGFSPWHGIQAHRPLGQLMRLRKLAYASSQRFRSERNATPVREPVRAEDIPD